MRVVADTNLLISALLFGGLPKLFLELGFAGSFELVTSDTLLDELDEKLRGKFAVPSAKAAALRSLLEWKAIVTHPLVILTVVSDDPDDNRVLECAVAAKAEVIVSGDRHLLRLGSYEATVILTVRQFLERAGMLP
ncbi:putative toxin-antitoxin system toxin component, PIN family [Acidobacteria bacterium AB60]|nr:putative toxin-antitoxin system toxin component, PIN family [Acidobacteria bacterium AB60]